MLGTVKDLLKLLIPKKFYSGSIYNYKIIAMHCSEGFCQWNALWQRNRTTAFHCNTETLVNQFHYKIKVKEESKNVNTYNKSLRQISKVQKSLFFLRPSFNLLRTLRLSNRLQIITNLLVTGTIWYIQPNKN